MSDFQKSMANGLRWTNFRYELLSSGSTKIPVPQILLETDTSVANITLSSSDSTSRKLLQTTNVTLAESIAEAQRILELRRLALVAYIEAKERERDEDICIDEHDCVVRMLNHILVVVILFALVVALHIGLMVTWLR